MASNPAKGHVGVLLMAYGSPDRLDDVEAYFTDIRGGRRPSENALRELTEKYARVGVPTPLLRVSQSLAKDLQDRLNDGKGGRFSVRAGMKHWAPRIDSEIAALVEAGAQRLVAIPLAPHYSRISFGGYRAQVLDALRRLPRHVPFDFVESWEELDGYIAAVAENLSRVRASFQRPDDVVVVFTAHSLPARILAEGDPYKDQLLRSSALVAERAGQTRWRFSFQSQSQTGEPWLGPDLLDTLDELAAAGERAVLVAPVGFIADHLEIFYDIDLEAVERAARLQIELHRTPMLNDDPRLSAALAALVRNRLDGSGNFDRVCSHWKVGARCACAGRATARTVEPAAGLPKSVE